MSAQKIKQKIVTYPINFKWGILIAIIAFALYANTISNDYTLDDWGAITGNHYVQEGFGGIPKLLKVDFWHFSNVHLGYYRPLSLVTFAVEYQFFKDNPHISHFINVLLFALSGFVLFILLSKLFNTYNSIFPFLASLLFIAHPIHTEIIANIKGRDELLSYLNIILMLWFALKFIDTKKQIHLGLSLVFCYLAMLSKETAVTGAILLPLFYYYYGNFKIVDCIKKSIPFIIVVVVFFIQKKIVLGALNGVIPMDIVNYPYTDSAIKLPTTFMIFALCLKLLFIPHPLRYDYSFNQLPAAHFSNIFALLGMIVFAIGVYFTYKEFMKRSTLGIALSIFFITLVPALAFILLRGGIFAERFLFFPSLGFSIAGVYGLAIYSKIDLKNAVTVNFEWIKSNTKFVIPIAVFVLLFSLKTVSRNFVWKNNFTLFSTDVKTGENSAQNQRHFGDELINKATAEKDAQKKFDYGKEAIDALRKSLSIYPKFGESYCQIGLIYQTIIFNNDSAIYYYNRATETAPGYANSYYYLGFLYQAMGRNDVASFYYNESVKYNPEFREGIDAKEKLQKATGLDVQINPLTSAVDTTVANKDTYYYHKLGNYFASQGNYDKAAQSFAKAVELDNSNEDSYINLANCYGMLKQYDKSIAVANQLLAKNPNDVRALENLSVTYKIMGDVATSEKYTQKVKEIRGN